MLPPLRSLSLGAALHATTALVTRFPVTTILVACLLAVVCPLMARNRLEFHTSRSDLLDPHCEYNRRWLEYTGQFGEQEDVVVVVQGSGPETVVPVLEEIAAQLLRNPDCFRAVFYKIDPSRLKSKGLYYLEPQQLRTVESFLSQAAPVLRGEWSMLDVGSQLAGFCGQLERGAARQLDPAASIAEPQPLATLAAALGQSGPYRSPWPEMPAPSLQNTEMPAGYVLTGGNRVGIVSLRLAKGKDGNFAEYAGPLALLRQIVAHVKVRHPETTIGLTGLPVLENDEMESSARSMTSCFSTIVLAIRASRLSSRTRCCTRTLSL